MKKSDFAALAILMGSAGFAAAQSPGVSANSAPQPLSTGGDISSPPSEQPPHPLVPVAEPAAAASSACNPVATTGDSTPNLERWWVSTDYMLRWIKNGPIAVPLVTTNPNANANIGALNEQGTAVIFGAPTNNLNYQTLSGLDFALGGWFDDQARFGAEISGFFLATGNANFSAASQGGNAPLVSIPFNAVVPYNFNPAGETSLNAGNAPNLVTVSATTRLWGAEVDNLFALIDMDRYRLVMLTGVRFMELDESLGLNDTFSDAVTGGGLSVTDTFHTRNQFFGANLGLRGEMNFGRLSVSATAKCAFGVDYELSDIDGNSLVTNGAFGFPTGSTPGGVFAQPSNIGRHTQSPFAVVPEGLIEVRYDVTQHIRGVVGYDFLYMSNVLRPGAQIDRDINPTQNVVLGGTGGLLVGPAAPLGAPVRSDFWAQGMNFGLQLHY